MIKFNSFAIVFILIFILAGCSGVKLAQYTKESCETPPGNLTLQIIDKKCMLCHKGDFSSPEKICSRKGLILDSIKSGSMPKIGSLSPEVRDAIISWK